MVILHFATINLKSGVENFYCNGVMNSGIKFSVVNCDFIDLSMWLDIFNPMERLKYHISPLSFDLHSTCLTVVAFLATELISNVCCS